MSLEDKFEKKNIKNYHYAVNKINDEYKSLSNMMSLEISKYVRKSTGTEGFSFTKAKQLEKKLHAMIGESNARVTSHIQASMRKGWALANTKNDILAAQYLKQYKLATEKYATYFNTNIPAMNQFVNRVEKGMNLSKRVWKNSEVVMDQVEALVGTGILEGRSANAISRDVRQALLDPDKKLPPIKGRYRSAWKNARRMTATETNMAYRLADHQRWQKMDFVIGIQVHLSDQHPLPDICDHMVGAYPKTFQFVGWHPSCFCYQTSILASKQDFINSLKGTPIPKHKIPGNMTQKISKYVKSKLPKLEQAANKPYWYAHNQNLISQLLYKKPSKKAVATGLAQEVPTAGKHKYRTDKYTDDYRHTGEVRGYYEARNESSDTLFAYNRKKRNDFQLEHFSKPGYRDDYNHLRDYTGEDYHAFNNWLEYGKAEGGYSADALKEMTAGASRGLEPMPKHKGVTFRGFGTRREEKFARLANMKPGDIYMEKTFMSTSLNRQTASGFARGDHRVYLRIHSKKGKIAIPHSNHETELEIIFDVNSKFIVDSVEEDSSGSIRKLYMTITEL